MESQRITVRRVGVGSAFKVGMVLSAVLFAIFGLLFLLGLAPLAALLSETAAQQGSSPVPALGLGIGGGILFYLIGIVFYAVVGGITTAFYAIFYNLAAGFIGGIEIDLA